MGPHIRAAVDVGKDSHHVGIADPKGKIPEEFSIPHSQEGFRAFFSRIERHRRELRLPVAVAMEGYNGHARPLDRMILEKGYTLYNVNNLKLARFREIFLGQDRLPGRAQDPGALLPQGPPAHGQGRVAAGVEGSGGEREGAGVEPSAE